MRWDYIVFYICLLGYIREVCLFCGTYLKGFRTDMEALENAAEQGEELGEAGSTALGGT